MGSGPQLQLCRESLPGDAFHHNVIDTALFAYVMDGSDIGVAKAGESEGFFAEPFARLVAVEQVWR